jgi:Domain of unknown function (DUF151)
MGHPDFGQDRGVSLRLVMPAPAVKMEEMPGLRRENAMTAATDTGLVPMRVSKAVALGDGDHISQFMVLDELDGDRHLVIGVGDAEAFALDASLQGLQWGRPMTYQFTAALVHSLGGRVREVRLDRIVEGAYAATEPFPSSLCGMNLQGVDGLGELSGAPGAAAELTQDSPGLELGVRALTG